MHAVRNIRLCTKDCLCLYVCPTGATDTENGQIDETTCISGCRKCVDACPSHAISLVPEEYPPQQEKAEHVVSSLMELMESKCAQEGMALGIANAAIDPIEKQIATALAISNRIAAEDLVREAGYMLPQSENVKTLLKSLLDKDQPVDFPKEALRELIKLL